MARQQRNDVDYFPHEVNHGKKMFIIEKKYGNDGYAVWHKLLEELGKADYHYLNFGDDDMVMYLASICNIKEEELMVILNDMVRLGGIFDEELYKHKILYNQKFVDSVSDAYKKRANDVVDKNTLLPIF